MTLKSASRRASGLPRSAIREIMSLAAGKPDVIHLEVGEPDAPTPAFIIDGALRAAHDGWTRYAPNAGLPSLRAKIAARVSRRWKASVAQERGLLIQTLAYTEWDMAGGEVKMASPYDGKRLREDLARLRKAEAALADFDQAALRAAGGA